MLWKAVFKSRNCISFTWEEFYIIADSDEHALRLGWAELNKLHPEGDDPDDPRLVSLEYVCDQVVEDAVPG